MIQSIENRKWEELKTEIEDSSKKALNKISEPKSFVFEDNLYIFQARNTDDIRGVFILNFGK